VKVILILAITIGIFVSTPDPKLTESWFALSTTSGVTWGAFGLATLAALWAFDGWEGIARVAGEVRSPQKTLPIALIGGIVAVFGLYALANLAYFWSLPLFEILTSNSGTYPDALPVATKASMNFLGARGVQILSAVFVISTIGAMNGSIMTSARIPYAMAKDQLFFQFLNTVSLRTRVPVRAVWIQGLIASLLALSGTFDQLTNYVVFSAWIIYGMTGISLFALRRRRPEMNRVFRVPGYPVVPGLFVVSAILLVANTLVQSPIESLIGLGFILAGIPIYFLVYRKA
jgi:basic amino acid/polyamine antiporter, APA family